MEFFINIQDNEVANAQVAWKYFTQLTDGRYKVTISKSNKRSLLQNNWIHAILPDILQGLRDIGYNEIRTTEDAKEVIKTLFFKKTVSNGSDSFEVIQGTSKTSKEDFSSKAEEIIVWAQTYLGINVAPPEKQTEIFHQ